MENYKIILLFLFVMVFTCIKADRTLTSTNFIGSLTLCDYTEQNCISADTFSQTSHPTYTIDM